MEAGCTSWDLYNHMLIPTLYDDDVKEYWHLVEKVTLWDVAVERQVEITGPDAARFTQLLTPRDLSQTQPEQCKYVLICAPDGGIVNDPILLKLAEDHFWLSLADSDALLYALGVQAFANMDVEIREPDVSPLQIQGPLSKPLIRKLFGDEVADQRYYWHKQTELDGIPVVVSRTGWSAELGYEVYLRDSSRALDLWDAIVAAGEEFELRAIAPSDQRRMEAGIFNYGNDMDITNNPFEITGLERLVELDNDNEFVSRKALERIRDEGVSQKLVGVRIDGEPLGMWLEDFWPVVDGGQGTGETIGRLVSALVLPAARVQHGLRVGADRARPARARASRSTSPDGPMTATVDADAVPRPEEGDPREGLKPWNPSPAHLLISNANLFDPNFRRTVVLIGHHDEDGAVGVVLNQPLDVTVREAVPPLGDLVEPEEQLFDGGPVEPASVVVVADFLDPARAELLAMGSIGFLPPEPGADIGEAIRRAACLRRVRRVGSGSARGRAGGGVVGGRARAARRRLPRTSPPDCGTTCCGASVASYDMLRLMPRDPSMN